MGDSGYQKYNVIYTLVVPVLLIITSFLSVRMVLWFVKYICFILILQFVAKKLDKRLCDLGAVAIIERGLGDDQHPSG